MKLSDLLDELRKNILNDRSDRIEDDDGDSDYLWTDETLVRYINEGCRRFARRSFIIQDAATTEVVNVTLEAGVSEYALHPSILAVISAKVSGAVGDLARVGHCTIGEYTRSDNVITPFSAAQLGSTAGVPQAFGTDEALSEDDDGSLSAVSMRVYPTPRAEDDGTVIKLRVIRMPINELTLSSPSAVPEIPADYHLNMLDWAAYLALRIVDTDAGNPKRAAEFAQSFETHVQEARRLVLRKLRAPTTWGFGRGGFRWGS
jgi:hypothetical protein